MLKATSLASRAFITALKFVRHISAATLGAVRGICPRSAAIHRGLHRSLSLALILAVFSTSTLADARSLAGIASEAQVSLTFWLNSAGLAGLLRRVFAGQQGPPEVKQQESQAERNGRVASIGIMPGDLKVRLGERVMFEAVAYDKAGVPVGGIDFQWEAQDVGRKLRARISPRGEFEARIPGTVIVTAVGAGQKAQTTIYVLDGVVPKRDAARETMREVSSRDLPAKSEPDPKLRSSSVVPMLMNDGFDNSNYWSADDPGNRRGNPPGSPPDEGAGSGNFQLSAPVIELPSRGTSVSLSLVYNSRLWNKAGSQITFDIDKDWPAPGWSLGFGKMMGMGVANGSMLIDADGTRHSYAGVVTFGYNNSYTYFNGHTSDGTLTDYTHYTGTGGALTWGEARRSDGTMIQYGASSQDALYPTRITDANGNYITITYVNNIGPQIQAITDTMGRTVSFYYDSYNLLTAIVGPGLNQGTRTLVRLHYRQIALSYGFAGLTTRVRDPYPWVVDAIYYPGTGTGYWFGDSDSYSSYGMIAKAVEQRGMIFSAPSLNVQGMVAPGAMTEQMVYNYPLAPNYSLTDAPTFTTQTETWAFMDTPAAVTTYFLQQNAFPRRTEITLPNGTRSVQLSFNAPGQFNDGMVYEDNTYDANSNLLHKSTTSWAQGAYNAPRPVRIEMRDERGQVTATEFDYGPQYNQVTTLRSYDFGGVTLLRTAFMQYENGAAYTYRHIFNLVKVAEVYAADGTRASRTEYQFDGQTLTDTPGVVMHSDAYNPYAPVYLVPGYCYWVCDDYCHEVCEPDYWVSDYDPSTNARGNVTQTASYADALYLTGPVTETKRYDIDGNIVTTSTSCCDQTSHNYTLATQYAYPASITQGAIGNPAAQVTQSDTYDFNTGLCVTSTDANGRTSQTTYFAQTLRPQVEYTPTGAYTSNAYDESAMSISETTFAASGAVAAQKVSFLDGLGNVRREEALTEGGAWDVVEARLDALGRLWRQTRPYRNGQEQPQWNVFTFDALSRVTRVQAPDGSETNMFYNEASRPDAATPGLPGETMRMVDSWGRERWRLTDAHKRLAEVVEPNPAGNGSVATGGLLTRYSYDGLDKLTAITQGNQQRSFRFDALGRMTHQKLSEASPTLNDSGQFVGAGSWSEVSTYDERSNLTSRTDARGVKTLFAYNADPLNRIQSISYDTSGFGDTGNPIVAAPTITYEYLTTGDVRRTSRLTTSGVSTEDFTFDVEGRVNSKTVTLALRPSYPMITDYIYDSLNRLTDVRYPAEYGYGGAPRKVVHHNFDVASRLSSVQVDGVNYASQVQYNAGSLVTSLNVGTNQVTESYTYDAATGFITGQKVQRGGTTLLDLGYDYLRPNTSAGRTSQLTRISNNLDHYKDRSYTYDALGRLTQATGGPSTWTENYAYDR
ncbi:MAG TPA: hypothetical protein VGV87_05745, partial [Blastocatellia bacterium]|nr:hypothetical protein [Blastocatellia bacterium]